jgi:hypothetical protein
MRGASVRAASLGVALATSLPAAALAQGSAAPVIDSIVVITRNVFDSAEVRRAPVLGVANAIRFTTRPNVVRRELLFRAGEPYDSARVAESARNLRALGLFRLVTIDTVRDNGRLVVVVRTADGWTTSLNVNARSTGGTFTWSLGLTERNFIGTGTAVGGDYRSDPDRSTLAIHTTMNRVGYTALALAAEYDKLSDGQRGTWAIGQPFRALSDGWGFVVNGEAAHQRVLEFRHEPAAAGGGVDSLVTTVYQRRAFVHGAQVGLAPIASTGGYVRVGLEVQVRREEFIAGDTLNAIADTVHSAVGVFGEWLAPRFLVVNHYNGFARDEDVDLSTKITVNAWAATTAFGYARGGIGPQVFVQTGVGTDVMFARVRAQAGALFSSAGLDSGTVAGDLTLALRVLPRQATVLHLEAGAQESPAPGAAFDLGNGVGPRAFGPHAFNGTRMAWGIFEHRVFVLDEVLKVLGLGFAGFLDYGGAWYPDQPRRLGGDVGLGLRFGATRATGPNLGRLDLAYRFGDGTAGKNHWIVSFGRSYTY